ncbi:hypothetical protein ACUMOB_001395 [Campylobacter coli]|nr:hypothetical protein [Campylobacter jejuni]MCW1353219.1 hypothetical protein [Campylobacter jejuni]
MARKFRKILILIKKAKQNSADLIVFPETSMAFVPSGEILGPLHKVKMMNLCKVF